MSEVTTLRRLCPLDCPDTCSLDVDVRAGRVVRIDGNERNPLTAGFICGKVRGYAEHVYHHERILHPLVREPGAPKGAGRFRRASWDEALGLVVARIRAARERHGGESILPCYYGGSNGKFTQDAADAVLFRRLGASRLHRGLCAAATTAAAVGMYGGMPGIPLTDYEHAELIVVWGANPHATGIHFVPAVNRARERGAKLLVVDPRATKFARAADVHLALRPGTDLPLALALIRWFFASGKADLDFLARHADGVDELRRRAEPWTIARAAEECGLEAEAIERFARLYAAAQPAALRCGWGPERNRNGCASIAAILALPAVAGKFGRRGGGYTMSNGRAFPLRSPINEPELTTRVVPDVRLGRTLLEAPTPPVEVLFVYNANPLATFPDQERVRRGLAREDLFTVVSEQVMTDTVAYADVVLPATTFLEHAELRSGYGAFALQLAERSIEPVGEARSNGELFTELIRRLDLARPGDDFSPRTLLRNVVGDEDTARALEKEGIVFPPCGEHPVQFVDVFPRTPRERIQLVPAELERGEQPFYHYRPDQAGFGSLTLISPATEKLISSSLGELLQGVQPLHVNPADAATRSIGEGDRVRLWNEHGEVVTRAHLDPHVRPGVVALHKGLWARHTENGATSNALIPDTLTDRADGACYNDARVELARA